MQPQFTDERNFKTYYKRLHFSLKKFDYDDLMAALRKANRSLNILTRKGIRLRAARTYRRPTTTLYLTSRSLKTVRKAFTGLSVPVGNVAVIRTVQSIFD